MNTEINFLRPKPAKHRSLIQAGIIFAALLALIASGLFYQKAHYQNMLDNRHTKLTQLENAIKEHQEKFSSQREEKAVADLLADLKASQYPSVALFDRITALLPAKENLVEYDTSGEGDLLIRANFKSLTAAADYVSKLVKEAYIADAQLTEATKLSEGYEAAFNLTLDRNAVTEELGTHD